MPGSPTSSGLLLLKTGVPSNCPGNGLTDCGLTLSTGVSGGACATSVDIGALGNGLFSGAERSESVLSQISIGYFRIGGRMSLPILSEEIPLSSVLQHPFVIQPGCDAQD